MRPWPVAIVARMARLLVHAELGSGTVKRDIHKNLQVSDISTERLPLKHPVVLNDGVDVLDPGTRELNPLVPRGLLGRQLPPSNRLDRRKKLGQVEK